MIILPETRKLQAAADKIVRDAEAALSTRDPTAIRAILAYGKVQLHLIKEAKQNYQAAETHYKDVRILAVEQRKLNVLFTQLTSVAEFEEDMDNRADFPVHTTVPPNDVPFEVLISWILKSTDRVGQALAKGTELNLLRTATREKVDVARSKGEHDFAAWETYCLLDAQIHLLNYIIQTCNCYTELEMECSKRLKEITL